LDKEASTRKKREIDLWRRWKFSNDQIALEELLASLRPIIKKQSHTWGRSGIPGSVIEGESKRVIMDALNDFDPNLYPNVALSTFIISRMKKVNRLVYKHQNVGRISEQRITQIGTYNNVKQYMKDDLGREPSNQELADELSWGVSEVERMERESRKDLLQSGFEFEPSVITSDRDKEVLDFLYFELTHEEQLVYDYLLGKHGKPQMKPVDIARLTGMSPAKVSRIRNRIREKFMQHVG
jgi:DNA-directed RNA polymerase specialized sigma subunit